MGKPVNSNAERVVNMKVNKEVFDSFRDYCKELGYPMQVMIETFVRQYANGKFKLKPEDILKYKDDGKEVDVLKTTLNKEIYADFKYTCKVNGYFIKHVITAFMEQFASRNFILEFTDVAKKR